MATIFDDISGAIGRTPLIHLRRLSRGLPGKLVGKLESRNPGGSVKDRIGLAMIAAARGYRLILTMPETMSAERVALLKAYGAEIVLTPGTLMMEAVERARKIVAETPSAIMLQQFENPANPAAHRATTAREIWEDTDGAVDCVVAGVGTGGTITGVGEVLKEKKPSVHMVAAAPRNAAALSGGRAGPHLMQGIGAGFIPKIVNRAVIDEVIPVGEDDAFACARRIASEEGILVGISAGAALSAALTVASREAMAGKMIVVILCDGGERYVTTPLFQELLADRKRVGKK